MHIKTGMQLPQWILQAFLACGNSRCGSQSEDVARHSHVSEGQNIAKHQVQPLEHKALSLPLPHPEDEIVFRIRGQAWS